MDTSYPLGLNQYLNSASREACGKDDFSRMLIYQQYLREVPRHLRGYDAELAKHFFCSAIEKLSPRPAANPIG
jgi:hypothetical protein